MNEGLRQDARAAVQRGLGFLENTLASKGRWPSWRYENTELAGDRYPEYPAFTAALGLLALDVCPQPKARALIARTCNFVRSGMRYPGIWRYPGGMPPSLDDIAMCSLAAGPHPWLRVGRLRGLNFDVILSNRDGDGRFRSWIQDEDWPPGLENEVDATVNANVLAYMGDHPETRAARRWLESVVAGRREVAESHYYIEPVDLHFALARASYFRGGAFSEMLPIVASRLAERLDAGEGFDDPMRTAQALSGLDMLAFEPHETLRSAVVERLLEAQLGDGSWRPSLAWKEPPGWVEWAAAHAMEVKAPRGFASESLTTVYCIEALERSL